MWKGLYQLLYCRQRSIRDENFRTDVNYTKEVDKITENGSAINAMPWLRLIWKRGFDLVKKIKQLDDLRRRNIHQHIGSFEKGTINDLTNMFLSAELPEVCDKTLMLSKRRFLVSLNESLLAGFGTSIPRY